MNADQARQAIHQAASEWPDADVRLVAWLFKFGRVAQILKNMRPLEAPRLERPRKGADPQATSSAEQAVSAWYAALRLVSVVMGIEMPDPEE